MQRTGDPARPFADGQKLNLTGLSPLPLAQILFFLIITSYIITSSVYK
jgi:hypothetical protein